jgi:branched-chain amino acid transport system substrate-binding protein
MQIRRRGAIALALVALTAAGCGGKKDEKDGLKGTVTVGVLAPTGRPGEIGARAKDLADGARLAVEETNAGGGVLGRKLELSFVDDGCDAQTAYEAAKAFVSDAPIAGVVGGMCNESAARSIPVLESSSLPFLITTATAGDLVSVDSTTAYMLNGTTYQQGLSAMYWMTYSGATRLAVLQDETPASKELARQAIGAVDEQPKLVSLQTVEPGGQDVETIAKAAIAAKPDFVLWTGGPEAGGRLVKALRGEGYEGTFTATAASEDPAFLAAAGPAGEGAFVTATATPLNTPAAEPWSARFEQRYRRRPGFEAQQGFDAVRTLAHAINRARSTEGAKVVKAMTTLDQKFSNALGVIRFAADHTLLYDNRVILKVKDGAFTWERSLRTDSLG